MKMKRFLFLFSLLLTSIVSVAQDKCLQLADSIVKYQSASGGWCKNQNWLIGADAKVMKVCHDTGVGSTIDNGATMTEMRNLVKAIDRLDEMMKHGFGDVGVETMQAKRNVYNDSFVRGVEYLLKMQYDNGGFPQFYPPKLHEDYSSQITFNDNAMVGALCMLRDVANGSAYFKNVTIPTGIRTKCMTAYTKGLQCVLDCQIRVDSLGKVLQYGTDAWKHGRRTVWCQQHDKATLYPAKARAYELPSYCGFGETCGILMLLMDVDNPSDDIKSAVAGAVEWLEAHAMKNVAKETFVNSDGKKDVRLVEKNGAPLLWARFYDLEEAVPFYCDRDGIPRRSLSDIGYERRNGYSWVGDQPAKIIERYKILNY